MYREDEMTPSVGWSKTMPWLYYPVGINQIALDSESVQSTMRFRGGSLTTNAVTKLTFVLATYSLEGDYLGMWPLSDELQVRA
jgi:hypothetical protein